MRHKIKSISDIVPGDVLVIKPKLFNIIVYNTVSDKYDPVDYINRNTNELVLVVSTKHKDVTIKGRSFFFINMFSSGVFGWIDLFGINVNNCDITINRIGPRSRCKMTTLRDIM